MIDRMKSGKRDVEALGDPAPTTCYSLCRQSRVFFSGTVLHHQAPRSSHGFRRHRTYYSMICIKTFPFLIILH